MFRKAFPRCTVEGSYEPVPYQHFSKGAVPSKCRSCRHLFEGECNRAGEEGYKRLDHGPCPYPGPTNPVAFEDYYFISSLFIPAKCQQCPHLQIDRVRGLTCGYQKEKWGHFPRNLDWGEWSPENDELLSRLNYLVLKNGRSISLEFVDAVKRGKEVEAIKIHQKLFPATTIKEAREAFSEVAALLTENPLVEPPESSKPEVLNLLSEGQPANVENWFPRNDQVIGGNSKSVLLQGDGESVIFAGFLLGFFKDLPFLGKTGAFAAQVTNRISCNLSGFSGIEIDCVGDGKEYGFLVTTGKAHGPFSFRAEIQTEPGERRRFRFGWNDFVRFHLDKAADNGTVLEAAGITGFGVHILSRNSGEFRLRIYSIRPLSESEPASPSSSTSD